MIKFLPERSIGPLALLLAFFSGAAVMAIEIVGARMVAPFFGVGLFVWTALIGMTLLALAFGYALGGWLADRPNIARVFPWVYFVAGAWLALTPLVAPTVLPATSGLGLRLGAMVASCALFFVPLCALGIVSPVLVRVALGSLQVAGRTAGWLYAVSTAGSFAGSILTGYFLLGILGLGTSMRAVAVLLACLGVMTGVWMARTRLRSVAVGLAVVAVAVVPALKSGLARQIVLDDGTTAVLVASENSYYGNVRVVDYFHSGQAVREMMIDGLVQGGIDLRDRQSIYEYGYLLAELPVWMNPTGKSALVIGLGAGIVPQILAGKGMQVTVVDIDPTVIGMARKYFGFSPRIPTVVEDARAFLNRSVDRYDLVVLDVFNGDTTPGHLLSIEAMRAIRERITPGGVLAINLVADRDPSSVSLASLHKTLRAVFSDVQVIPVMDSVDPGGVGNLVVFARGTSMPSATDFVPASVHSLAMPGVLRSLQGGALDFSRVTAGLLLSDDFNPLDLLDAKNKEQVRRGILTSTRPELLFAI